jgi:hypothetical protein
MATIFELIAKHSKVPGDIKVRRPVWSGIAWFQPYYTDADGDFVGPAENGYTLTLTGLDPDYELYVEPKPKVKRWLWASLTANGWWVRPYYMTEADADADTMYRCKTRLDWSEQEFDE